MLAALRDCSWLTEARARTYGAIVIIMTVLLFAAMFVTADGNLDLSGKPLGTDFSEIWVAGRSVLAGHPESPFDPWSHAAAQAQAFGSGNSFYGWHYPPYFLAVATISALMPYLIALVVWQISSLTFYLGVMWRILPGTTAMIGAAAFPAVYVNMGHGHNGFLTAGLLGSALLCVPGRPILSGVLFGLLAYKPQFGLVVPLALLAGGYWRTIVAGMVTLVVMTAASVAAFGVESWVAFEQSLTFTRTVVLEDGNTGWEKIQSTFAAVRMWGAPVPLAYTVQALTSTAVLAAVFWVWRMQTDRRLRGAAVLAATLLATPYCLDYDLMLLGPALAFLVAYGMERGFLPWERTALAAIWALPLFARIVAQHTAVPIGLFSIMGVFALTLRRAALDVNKLLADRSLGVGSGRS